MSEVALAAAEAPLVLALDVGTSSVRAIVYDARGRAVAGAAARGGTEPRTTPDGGVEIDADALVACTASVLDALLARAPEAVAAVLSSLTDNGCWLTPLTTTSHPYNGPSPAAVTGGEYQTTRVGDLWDVSPYNTDFPPEGISTAVFIKNMGDLIEALQA